MTELLETLRALEESLHQGETRRDPVRLEALLHPEFEEIGRSGRRFSRREILAELAPTDPFPAVVSSDYALTALGDDVALLTYRSAHVGDAGRLYRHSLRSSIWVRTSGRWRVRFHQGTPAGEEHEARRP